MDYPPWLKQSLRAASKKGGSGKAGKHTTSSKSEESVPVNEEGIDTCLSVNPRVLRERRDTALSSLSELERSVVKMRFGFDGEPTRTDSEIAKVIGCSEREVRDLSDVILRKLRWPTQH